MDFLTSMDISSSGMAANRKRMNAISSNIANAQTTRTVEGGPYRRKEVIFGAEPARENFSDILEGEMGEKIQKVHATEVLSINEAPILKYEPGHVDANEKGYVAYPNINVMKEMANMISASRSYEANISALNTAKSMAMKSLEIGR
jgi:flagellar basal-body rod protein FlgC